MKFYTIKLPKPLSALVRSLMNMFSGETTRKVKVKKDKKEKKK
ncbi:MAG: stage V sporulation protein M [Candidatus Carbobacillus sp.]|nr:stage V sporulation protein M [Candidatus Carbobacillus sp.]